MGVGARSSVVLNVLGQLSRHSVLAVWALFPMLGLFPGFLAYELTPAPLTGALALSGVFSTEAASFTVLLLIHAAVVAGTGASAQYPCWQGPHQRWAMAAGCVAPCSDPALSAVASFALGLQTSAFSSNPKQGLED